jgi:hypothetical protein
MIYTETSVTAPPNAVNRDNALLATCVGFALSLACSSGKANVHFCSDMICHNEFVASIALSASNVPSGTQSVNIIADGSSSVCTFEFPPEPGAPAGGQCSGGATLVVQSVSNCQTVTGDGTFGERCDAIAGQYTELIIVQGIPKSARVQQTVNASVIFDSTAEPSYHENQPNGPDCPPSCQQATVQWSI